jgi:hypothetical protein
MRSQRLVELSVRAFPCQSFFPTLLQKESASNNLILRRKRCHLSDYLLTIIRLPLSHWTLATLDPPPAHTTPFSYSTVAPYRSSKSTNTSLTGKSVQSQTSQPIEERHAIKLRPLNVKKQSNTESLHKQEPSDIGAVEQTSVTTALTRRTSGSVV